MYCATNYNLLPTVLVTPLYNDDHDTREQAEKRLKFAEGYGAGLHIQRKLLQPSGFRVALKLWNWHLGWEFHLDVGITRGGPTCESAPRSKPPYNSFKR
jgi:hypothetical protein